MNAPALSETAPSSETWPDKLGESKVSFQPRSESSERVCSSSNGDPTTKETHGATAQASTSGRSSRQYVCSCSKKLAPDASNRQTDGDLGAGLAQHEMI